MQKEGLQLFECSAKTNENIKKMFYSSIAGLPTFGVYDNSEKESLISELLEENCGEEFKGSGTTASLSNQPQGVMNVNGEISNGQNWKKKKCGF